MNGGCGIQSWGLGRAGCPHCRAWGRSSPGPACKKAHGIGPLTTSGTGSSPRPQAVPTHPTEAGPQSRGSVGATGSRQHLRSNPSSASYCLLCVCARVCVHACVHFNLKGTVTERASTCWLAPPVLNSPRQRLGEELSPAHLRGQQEPSDLRPLLLESGATAGNRTQAIGCEMLPV